LQSGQPVTYPNGQYTYLGVVVLVMDYVMKNRSHTSFRCFCYFITYQNENKNWKGEWVLVSITFIIAKMQHLNFRQNENTGANEAVKHPFSELYQQLVIISNLKHDIHHSHHSIPSFPEAT
jgi:hypothetical protein